MKKRLFRTARRSHYSLCAQNGVLRQLWHRKEHTSVASLSMKATSLVPESREMSMVQGAAPQGDSSQDDMTLPMLDHRLKRSSSDPAAFSVSKGHQRCSPPDVIEAAAPSRSPSAQLPEVSSSSKPVHFVAF